MSSEKKLSPPTIEAQIEDGSPQKGFGLVVKWALWIVQATIAYFFAILVWGDLVKSPSVFDTSLSILSVSALYGIVKAGVTVFFKRINYLFLYLVFYLGLLLYQWSLNLILPAEWLAYWWLPYLFIAPLILELPVINLGITKFISWKLYSSLMWIAVASVFPYILIYAAIFGIVHPIQSFHYLKKNSLLSPALRILVGVAACTIAVRLIFKNLEVSLMLLFGFIGYLIVIVVILSVIGVVALLNSQKINFLARPGIKRLFHFIQILVFPFWIITNISIIPNSDLSSQKNRKLDSFLTVPAASISVGVMIFAFMLKYIHPNTILIVYWVINFLGACGEILLTIKPKIGETKIYTIFNALIFIFLLPFLLISGVFAGIEQAQNQPIQSPQQQVIVESTVIETGSSESKAG